MAWSAPPAWSVGQVVTAAQMTNLSDDLNYLKGTGGTFVLFDGTIVANGWAGNPTQGGAVGGLQSSGSGAGITVWRRTLSAYPGIPARGDNWTIYNPDGSFRWFDTNDRMTISAAGYLGVGTTAPQGPLHGVGVGGGFVFLSAANVGAGVITLAAAGTVTGVAMLFGFSRNNGTGVTITNIGQALALGGVVNNTGSDTLQIAVTAGGAITAQRTAGTQTHNVNLMVVYV